MIPLHIADWFATGTKAILAQDGSVAINDEEWNACDLSGVEKHAETIQIAIGVAIEFKKWANVLPAIYIPDGKTTNPANNNGRVIIVVYKFGAIHHTRLGSIIFEDGLAHININRIPQDENVQFGDEEKVGSSELSNPDFPATIFKLFESVLV